MILVDSSVWIDAFRGVSTPQVTALKGLLGRRRVMLGDLIMTEVLQGFGRERDFEAARRALQGFTIVAIAGADVAVQAARNHRHLRERGVTVRKTIDTLIATRCIVDGFMLLHSDRDFTPFAEHLGLKVYAPAPAPH